MLKQRMISGRSTLIFNEDEPGETRRKWYVELDMTPALLGSAELETALRFFVPYFVDRDSATLLSLHVDLKTNKAVLFGRGIPSGLTDE